MASATPPPRFPSRNALPLVARRHADTIRRRRELLDRSASADGGAANEELLEKAPHVALVSDLGHQAMERASGELLEHEERPELVDQINLVVDVLDLLCDLERLVPMVERLVRLVEVDEASSVAKRKRGVSSGRGRGQGGERASPRGGGSELSGWGATRYSCSRSSPSTGRPPRWRSARHGQDEQHAWLRRLASRRGHWSGSETGPSRDPRRHFWDRLGGGGNRTCASSQNFSPAAS